MIRIHSGDRQEVPRKIYATALVTRSNTRKRGCEPTVWCVVAAKKLQDVCYKFGYQFKNAESGGYMTREVEDDDECEIRRCGRWGGESEVLEAVGYLREATVLRAFGLSTRRWCHWRFKTTRRKTEYAF